MTIKEIIKQRRSLRTLGSMELTSNLFDALAEAAQLAPSCSNNQPWKFVFIADKNVLEKYHEIFTRGNYWAKKESFIIAVTSQKDLDCIEPNREYFLFDAGIAVGFMLLQMEELGIVGHPIAGFDDTKAKSILGIPDNVTLITLIICGGKTESVDNDLSEKHKIQEQQRPVRKPISEIIYRNYWGNS